MEGAILRSIALYNWFSASHTENGYSVASPSIPLRTYTHAVILLSISLIFSLSLSGNSVSGSTLPQVEESIRYIFFSFFANEMEVRLAADDI